jgi:hypothetical protein
MTSTGKYVNALFLLAAFGVILAGVLLKTIHNDDLFDTFIRISAAASALLAALVGLGLFARGGPVREDRFRIMNLAISVGLVLFFIANLVNIVLPQASQGEMLTLEINLVQLFGLMFWVMGIVGYLRASNQVLGYVSRKTMWVALLGSSTLCALPVLLWDSEHTLQPNLLESAVKASFVFGVTLVVVSLAALFSIFRAGRLSLPLGLGFVGVFLMMVQNLATEFVCQCVAPYTQILTVVVYLFLGASLSAAGLLRSESAFAPNADGDHGTPLPPTAGT